MALVNESRNKDAISVLHYVHKKELSEKYFTHGIRDDDSSKNHQLGDITRTSNLLRTRFKLVTAMGNSGSCKEARSIIDEGLAWTDSIDMAIEKIERNMIENGESDLSVIHGMKNSNMDNKAYLLVAKSRCSADVAGMARAAYEAVLAKPQMEYALKYAESVGGIVEKIQSSGLNPAEVFTDWEMDNNTTRSQTAKMTFKFKQS